MRYDYLDNSEERCGVLKKILAGKIRGMDVFDLDCGSACLVKCLKGFKSYSGNDIDENYIKLVKSYGIKNSHFNNVSDENIRVGNIDVLLLLGYSAAHLYKSLKKYNNIFLESKTSFNALKKLVARKKPKYVLVENIKYFETEFNADTEIKVFMENNKYKLDKEVEFKIKSKHKKCRIRNAFLFKKICT